LDNQPNIAFEVFKQIFQYQSYLSKFFLLSLISKGWLILVDIFPLKKVVIPFVNSLLFVILDNLLKQIDSGNLKFLILILEFIALILYLQDLIFKQNLNEIQNQFPNLKQFFHGVIFIFSFSMILKVFLEIGYDFKYWFGSLYEDLTDLIYMISIIFIFRYQKSQNDDQSYTSPPPPENQFGHSFIPPPKHENDIYQPFIQENS
jgi:hypothetical protein